MVIFINKKSAQFIAFPSFSIQSLSLDRQNRKENQLKVIFISPSFSRIIIYQVIKVCEKEERQIVRTWKRDELRRKLCSGQWLRQIIFFSIFLGLFFFFFFFFLSSVERSICTRKRLCRPCECLSLYLSILFNRPKKEKFLFE